MTVFRRVNRRIGALHYFFFFFNFTLEFYINYGLNIYLFFFMPNYKDKKTTTAIASAVHTPLYIKDSSGLETLLNVSHLAILDK